MEIYENLDLNDLKNEIWKVIEEFEDYCISDYGRVKSFKFGKERILEQNKNTGGYFCVGLCDNKKIKTKQIHTLMYETFIENVPKGYVVHHIDFTINNLLDNFQLITRAEHLSLHHKNKIVSEETKELMSEKKKGENHPRGMLNKNHSEKSRELMRGENSPNSILTEQDIIKIRLLCDEEKLTQADRKNVWC